MGIEAEDRAFSEEPVDREHLSLKAPGDNSGSG